MSKDPFKPDNVLPSMLDNLVDKLGPKVNREVAKAYGATAKLATEMGLDREDMFQYLIKSHKKDIFACIDDSLDADAITKNIDILIDIFSTENLRSRATDYLDTDADMSLIPTGRNATKLLRGAVKQAFKEVGPVRTNKFLQSLLKHNKLGEFVELGESQYGLIPINIRMAANKLLAANPATAPETPPDIAVETVEALLEKGETAPEVPTVPETFLDIKVVEVDDLLPEGESETELLPGSRARITDEESANKRTQPRLAWIVNALVKDGFDKNDMVIYKESEVGGLNRQTNPYIVLEAQKGDKHFQIAVCQTVNNATYVIREPIDFKEGAVTTIADLKRTPTVFQFNCYSETQWIRDMRHYAYTELEKLPVQLKSRIAWGDKKSAVEDSFGQFYREFEQSPFVHDKSIISHGALAGMTTWNRLYSALRKQNIPGLEHVRNYPDLKDHLFGAKENPVAEPVSEPVLEFDAQEVFRMAVLHIRDTKTVPAEDPEFIRSLKAGKVRGLDAIIGDDAELINCKNEFLVSAGLAEEKGGELVPASPVLINQLARVLNDGAPTQQLI